MKPLFVGAACFLMIAFASLAVAQEPGSISWDTQPSGKYQSRQEMINQLQNIIAQLDAESKTDLQARLNVVQQRLTDSQTSVSDQAMNTQVESEVDVLQMSPTVEGTLTWTADSGQDYDIGNSTGAVLLGGGGMDSSGDSVGGNSVFMGNVENSPVSYGWSQSPGAMMFVPGPIAQAPMQTVQAPVQFVQAPAPVINVIQAPPVIVAPRPIYRVYAVQIPIYADVVQPVQRRHHGCRLFNH